MTAQQVHDLVRALSGSYPGAFTFHRGRKVVLETTRRLDETIIAAWARSCAARGGRRGGVRGSALLVVEARDEMPRDATFDAGPARARAKCRCWRVVPTFLRLEAATLRSIDVARAPARSVRNGTSRRPAWRTRAIDDGALGIERRPVATPVRGSSCVDLA